jgi:transposase
MKARPVEYRHRVIALTDDGQSTGEIAEALGVSGAWVRSIKARRRAGDSLALKSSANNRRSLAEREGDRLRARVREHPGTTLEDLKRDLNLDAAVSTIWNALRDLKLSLKKKRSGPPSGPGRTSPPTGPSGTSSRPASTPGASSSSTRRSGTRP